MAETSANEITPDRVRGPATVPGHFRPEWLRIPHITATFGIGRTKIYELIAEGKIRSVSLRKRGQTKGTRLVSYDSVVEYLEGLATTE